LSLCFNDKTAVLNYPGVVERRLLHALEQFKRRGATISSNSYKNFSSQEFKDRDKLLNCKKHFIDNFFAALITGFSPCMRGWLEISILTGWSAQINTCT